MIAQNYENYLGQGLFKLAWFEKIKRIGVALKAIYLHLFISQTAVYTNVFAIITQQIDTPFAGKVTNALKIILDKFKYPEFVFFSIFINFNSYSQKS